MDLRKQVHSGNGPTPGGAVFLSSLRGLLPQVPSLFPHSLRPAVRGRRPRAGKAPASPPSAHQKVRQAKGLGQPSCGVGSLHQPGGSLSQPSGPALPVASAPQPRLALDLLGTRGQAPQMVSPGGGPAPPPPASSRVPGGEPASRGKSPQGSSSLCLALG